MLNTSLRPFTILLIGQSISLFGSSLTGFALGVWAYQQVQSASIYIAIFIAGLLPVFLLSPLAGAVADRWNRKKIIVIAQIAAISITAILAMLYWNQSLEPWHIVALVALNSVFSAFVLPTLAATVPLMVPKGSLIRANGMVTLAFGLVELTSPAAAGALFDNLGMQTIFIIDLSTFAIGLGVVLITRIPQPAPKEELEEHDDEGHESIWLAIRSGWHYLQTKPGLFGMIVFFSAVASTIMAAGLLVQPMILGFADAQTMGNIMSIAGVGMLIGSVVMIILKNVERHIPFLLIPTAILAICCIYIPMTKTPLILAIGGFLMMICFVIMDANNRALFQRKVEPSMLGRVIGLRNFALGIFQTITLLVCLFLSDVVLGPGMQEGGAFAPYLGDMYGTGNGRGIAVLISTLGFINLCVVLIAFMIPKLRKVDTLLPDVEIKDEDEETELDASAAKA